MQLFLCENTGTVKHSGTKFNGTAITCNSYTGTYCAKFLLPGPQKKKAKVVILYKCNLYRQNTPTFPLKKFPVKNSHS